MPTTAMRTTMQQVVPTLAFGTGEDLLSFLLSSKCTVSLVHNCQCFLLFTECMPGLMGPHTTLTTVRSGSQWATSTTILSTARDGLEFGYSRCVMTLIEESFNSPVDLTMNLTCILCVHLCRSFTQWRVANVAMTSLWLQSFTL